MENQIYFAHVDGPIFVIINTTDYNGPEYGCGVMPFTFEDADTYGVDADDQAVMRGMSVGDVVDTDMDGAYIMRIA